MPTAIRDAFACYSLASSAAYRRHPLPALSVSGSGPSALSSSKVKRSGRAGCYSRSSALSESTPQDSARPRPTEAAMDPDCGRCIRPTSANVRPGFLR